MGARNRGYVMIGFCVDWLNCVCDSAGSQMCGLRDIFHAGFGTDINGGVTFHQTLVTAAKHIADNTNCIRNELFIVCFSSPKSLGHIDVYFRATIYLCLETSTVDIVYTGG